jgi:hypothetical protein
MTTIDNEKLAKTSNFFKCDICNYTTCKKFNINIHFETKKHKNNVLTTKNNESLAKTSKKFICLNCDKGFNDRSGLWRHNKKCKHQEQPPIKDNDELTDKELILMIIKENSEFKNFMMEQSNIMLKVIENGTHNTTNNTNNTNSHNKSFNLQFFLNETCKDAMNIMDFVNSIQLQLSDLERVGELGYVEGISNIITSNLKALDVTQRPVHCTDKKREVLYVKDEDKWEKENEQKVKLRKAIKRVASKNLNLLPKFKEAYPDCSKASSLYSDKYNKIIVESCGGAGDNDLEKEDKIIKNITKNITIEKDGDSSL